MKSQESDYDIEPSNERSIKWEKQIMTAENRSMRPFRQGICVKKDTKKSFRFTEYRGGIKIYRNGILDGILNKEYFEKNYIIGSIPKEPKEMTVSEGAK